jgi:hypothetical protein
VAAVAVALEIETAWFIGGLAPAWPSALSAKFKFDSAPWSA